MAANLSGGFYQAERMMACIPVEMNLETVREFVPD
jgi:hypothetical protein